MSENKIYVRHVLIGITIVVILLSVGASAAPLSGEWKGKTSQGYDVKFTITGSINIINPFEITISGCGLSKITYTSNIPIINDEFRYIGSSYSDSYYGKFTSNTAAKGYYKLYDEYCYPAVTNVTWEASLNYTPPPNSLVAEYHFNGTAQDSSGNGNHGTINGGATFVPGISGQALSFDGLDDYVSTSVTGLPVGNIARTVTAWFNTNKVPANYNSIATQGSVNSGNVLYGIYLRSNGKVYSETGSGANQLWSATAKNDGNWHYAVLSFDGSIQKLYVDGVLEQSTGSITLITPSSTFTMGKFVGGTQYFTGTIDEVRIYNRALTAEEIKAHYVDTIPNPNVSYTVSSPN